MMWKPTHLRTIRIGIQTNNNKHFISMVRRHCSYLHWRSNQHKNASYSYVTNINYNTNTCTTTATTVVNRYFASNKHQKGTHDKINVKSSDKSNDNGKHRKLSQNDTASLILTHSPKAIIQQPHDKYLDSPFLDQSLSLPQESYNVLSIPSSLSSSSSSHLLSNYYSLNNNNNNNNNLFFSHQTSMYDPSIHLPNKPNFNNPKLNYESATPLGDELMKFIAVNGSPITVAEYMKQCLRNEEFGYYTNPPSSSSSSSSSTSSSIENNDSDKIDNDNNNDNKGYGHRLIGQHGDFTTAPEISQIFGECITIWLLTQYETLHKPKQIQLIELGPGRGTLMCDILRTASSIKGLGQDFINALCCTHKKFNNNNNNNNNNIHGVHFVEVSENLRFTQKETLDKMQQDTTKPWFQNNNKMMNHTTSTTTTTTTTDTTTTTNNNNNNNKIQFHFHKWETKKEKEERIVQIMNTIREKKALGQEMNDELLEEILLSNQYQNHHQQHQHQQQQKNDNNNISSKNDSKQLSIHWHDNFNSVPYNSSIPTFIICQEFFDALPVHVFQKTQNGWRERLVDVAIEGEDDDDDDDINNNIKEKHGTDRVRVKMLDGTITSIHSGISSSSLSSSSSNNKSDTSNYNSNDDMMKKRPRFRFVLSPDVTPALRTLLHTDDNGNTPTIPTLNNAPIGTIMEVSPESLTLVQDMAIRINECQGAGLIIDYGNEGSKDTLRAFHKHQQVDVLSSPGTVDITADVDFTAMKNAINNINNDNMKKMETEAFGPKTQGAFLSSMGAVERTIQLIEDDNTTDDQAEDLCTALERLVSVEEMGERFKVLSIAKKKEGIFPPPGF